MGTEYSCVKQPTETDDTSLSPIRRPALLVNNTVVIPKHNLSRLPHPNSADESGIPIHEQNTLKNEFPKTEMWAKQKTNDVDPSKDDSQDHFFKKATSFFRFSSLDSRYQADPTEYANDQNKSDWRLQNVKLEKIIHMSQGQGKYLWEAYNVVTQQKCTVKITLFEKSKLVHNNYFRTEKILRNLAELQSPNVINVYSFSVFETEFESKLYMAVIVIQEPVKCSLKDIDTLLTKKKDVWTQEQLLIIIRDIYNGLVACKEKQLTHGRIALENILVSENTERILIADLDIRMPLVNENRTASSRTSILKSEHASFLTPNVAEKVLAMPDEKDINDLTMMILRMLTNDEKMTVLSTKTLRKNERYKQSYLKVLDILDLISQRNKPVTHILHELESPTKKANDKLNFNIQYNLDPKHHHENQIDTLFSKLDCYELLNQSNKALEVCQDLMDIFEKKESKNSKDYQEYIKCVNHTIKHYLSIKDWLRARDLSVHLGNTVKKEPLFKSTLKANPKEYINFTFLLGNISEGLGEPDKAITFYAKGLAYCSNQHLGLDTYSSTLKRISNLYMQKKEHTQALECLRKLVDFYETQEGYFFDRVDGYLNMGDILTQQGNFGQGVKLYLKSLENIKKGKMNNNEAMLNIIGKIVSNYKLLHEDDNVLRYMIDSLELKKRVFGRESTQYMEGIKEIAETQVRLENYEAALNHYLIYQKVVSDAGKQEQYLESLAYLGDIYVELGEYENARKSFEKHGNMEKEAKGFESKDYLFSQDKIASIDFREGKIVKSLKIQLETLAIKEKILKSDDLYLAVSLNNIGDTYFSNEEYRKALKFHKASLDRLDGKQKQFKEEYSQLLLRISMDYHRCGESGKALQAVHQSFEISKGSAETNMNHIVEIYELISKTIEGKKSLDFAKLTKKIQIGTE